MPEEKKEKLTEEEILINKSRTDPEAFGLLYERYVDKIFNYVYFRVGSTDDAQDLTAKVFFKALKSISSYRHMGLPFSAWLYRIAHNLVANYHRDRSKMVEISIENLTITDTSKASAPEVQLSKQQDNAYLLKLINDLSPQKKELIILKFVQRLSNEEIGQIFGKTEGAIKSLYHRTLLELKDRAKDDSDTRNL
ncbi:MAG TPA: sigma-70 family RNA polymerase sigma factor [Chloroflexi bacterium]|jgi:RNA polymerase sigma-70 factor (ECF subfamily)|nr:sigma-70 family RNA polymerase sigma factor [Chloroflexota bacterium]